METYFKKKILPTHLFYFGNFSYLHVISNCTLIREVRVGTSKLLFRLRCLCVFPSVCLSAKNLLMDAHVKNVSIQSCRIFKKDKNSCFILDIFGSDLSLEAKAELGNNFLIFWKKWKQGCLWNFLTFKKLTFMVF